MTWQDRAACTGLGPDRFYADAPGEFSALIETTRRICAACPVQQECLDYSKANGITDGIWGGLTKSQRQQARKTGFEARPCPQCSRLTVCRVVSSPRKCPSCSTEEFITDHDIDPEWYEALSVQQRKRMRYLLTKEEKEKVA